MERQLIRKAFLGLTEASRATFSWWKVNKWSDTYGPYAMYPTMAMILLQGFYLDNYEHVNKVERDRAKAMVYD